MRQKYRKGLPLGGPVVKNPPYNTSGTSLIPSLRRSHTPQSGWTCVLCSSAFAWEPGSPWAGELRLLKPECARAHAPQEKLPRWEALALQPEKACVQQQRPSATENKQIHKWIFFFKCRKDKPEITRLVTYREGWGERQKERGNGNRVTLMKEWRFFEYIFLCVSVL